MWGSILYVLCKFYCQYLDGLNECVKLIVLEEDAINVMSYLCYWRKLNAVKILPPKTLCNGSAIEIPHVQPGKEACAPLKMKRDCC